MLQEIMHARNLLAHILLVRTERCLQSLCRLLALQPTSLARAQHWNLERERANQTIRAFGLCSRSPAYERTMKMASATASRTMFCASAFVTIPAPAYAQAADTQ